MSGFGQVNLGTVFAAFTSLAALILSYRVYKRDQKIRRTAQARLVTAWWTRVSRDTGEDLYLGNASGSDWPEESGYRIWVSNSSDDAVYNCAVIASIQPTTKLLEQLKAQGSIFRQYITYREKELIIGIGAVPPKQQQPFFVELNLIDSVGRLRIEFTDSNGVDWRRVAGKLTKRSS